MLEKRKVFIVIFSLFIFIFLAYNIGVYAEDFEGEIEIYTLNYTPGIERGGDLDPLKAMEEVAEKYMEIHPEVKISFLKMPRMNETDYMSWIVAQSAGGTIPHIVWGHTTQFEQYKEDEWFVDIYPYLQEPNPYVKGNEKWYDLFYKNPVELRRSPDGSLWSLPIDLVATIIYYNKDVFNEVGVEIPENWAEFMDIQEKLQEAGQQPFLFGMKDWVNFSWIYRVLFSHFYEPLVKEIDVLDTPGQISSEEFVRAYEKGLFRAGDERHQDIFRMIKDWSEYWPSGFTSYERTYLRDEFLRENGAMFWQTCTEMSTILQQANFDVGFFYVPQITKETSEFANDKKMRMVGGASGEQLAITTTAINEDKVELSVDFLKFLTAPENNAEIVNEAELLMPIMENAPVPEIMEPVLPQFDAGVSPFIVERFLSTEQMESWLRYLQMFFTGMIDQEEITNETEKMFENAVDRLNSNNQYNKDEW